MFYYTYVLKSDVDGNFYTVGFRGRTKISYCKDFKYEKNTCV